ncbi:hypothetical protein HHL21_15800 [Massilia sp. RP-1-19]|uniref:Uncharacterized protein n=1 Tax=Massilia polaris TaxID=2728846 RepID=A0A848HRZ2_9BURK|nr:hypothetical protein [Massilia polaris]NML62511.1 hypothetical protein [Massilia polaris]
MPRQGILPHDLIHYVVEDAFGYTRGFLGMVASGSDIGFAMEQSHDANNSELADQAAHAEAIVESLQAQLWSGAFDAVQFDEGLRSACVVRGRPVPDIKGVDVGERLYMAVLALTATWQVVPSYGILELDMTQL